MKVSLLAADGSLDGIDLIVLVTMFVFVFGVWWAYFDDVPAAGIRPCTAAHRRLAVRPPGPVQLALVASAVGYGKVLGFELGTTLTDDTSLLLTTPLVGVLARARADRRVQPARPPTGPWSRCDSGTAAVVAVGALRHLADAAGSAPTAAPWSSRSSPSRRRRSPPRCCARTHVESARLSPSPGGTRIGYKGTRTIDDPGELPWPCRRRDHYTLISADTHAGANHETYREYLDQGVRRRLRRVARQVQEPVEGPARHQPARAQLGRRAPQRRPGGGRRRRRGDLPEHGAAVLPELRALRRRRRSAEDYEHRRAGIQAHNRWLVDFCSPLPRAARRHRPDLPQRHRRRHRGREVDQGARPARRRPAAEHPARREVGEAALRPGVRPAVGGAARTSRSRSTRTAAPAHPTTASTRRCR